MRWPFARRRRRSRPAARSPSWSRSSDARAQVDRLVLQPELAGLKLPERHEVAAQELEILSPLDERLQVKRSRAALGLERAETARKILPRPGELVLEHPHEMGAVAVELPEPLALPAHEVDEDRGREEQERAARRVPRGRAEPDAPLDRVREEPREPGREA